MFTYEIEPRNVMNHGIREKLKQQIFSVNLKSWILIVSVSLLLLMLLYLIAGIFAIMTMGLMILVIYSLQSQLPPEKIMRIQNASYVPREYAYHLYNIIASLSEKAGLDALPDLYIIHSMQMNAFTAGNSNHSAIALTDGLISALNNQELESVLAHEVAHIKNQDTSFIHLAAVFSNFTSIISFLGLLMLLFAVPALIFTGNFNFSVFISLLLMVIAPYLSHLIFMAFSRTREFKADLTAVQLTGRYQYLASALKKIDQNPVSLFEIFFGNLRRKDAENRFLMTHPPTRERIENLIALTH